MLTPDPCSVTLATENDTAPSAQSPKHEPLITLHDPYGPSLSFSAFWDLVRDTFLPESTAPPPDLEPGEREAHPLRRNLGRWWEFIWTLIRQFCSLFQMQLSAMYYRRVKAIIRKSKISMADFASIKQSSINRGMIELTKAASAFCMPAIKKIHSQFEEEWKAFVGQCMKEWTNLNVISTLLMRYVSSNII